MTDKYARMWSGTGWVNISSPVASPNAVAVYQATAPSSPVTGQIWIDSDDNIPYVWNGSSWGPSPNLSLYAPIASPTFTGTPAAPTPTAGTNTTQIATTAFVTTADNLKANIVSPTLTGIPAAPTATVDTNTTQIATTAFVIAQASGSNPLALGSVAQGTSTRYARQDHVHPTTGLGLTSGTLAQFAATTSSQLSGVISDETGSGALVFATSPTLTTPNIGVATGTSFNSITGLSSTNPIVNGTAAVGTGTTVARADHVHPTDTSRAPLASPTFTGTVTAVDAVVSGLLTVAETTEVLNSGTIASNVFTADFSTGGVFYITTAPAANFTINVTNLPTTDNRVTVISFFVIQGATGFIPNALQIGGSAQTIKWFGGTAPTATNGAGKVDNFTFTFIRRGAAWEALGTSNRNF